MFSIVRYTPAHATLWNAFVASSKNGTFLFDRRYMDYHSDRFHDHSLLFFLNGRLYALIAGEENGSCWRSHMGLTYGGLVMDCKVTAAATVTLFQEMNDYLRRQGFSHVVYKCVPWIYHRLPAEEDLYAIFRLGNARLAARDIGSVIIQPATLRWERVRRRALKRAEEHHIEVRRSTDFAEFWNVLDHNLMTKYHTHPVHTLEEITLLHSRFPEQIILYEAWLGGEIVAGIVLYVTPQVIHAQYSSATERGKQIGAIDILYDRIINHDFAHCRYFDFGRSTEERGTILNESLIFQKEGFGGRGMCWDWYEWDL